jgi:hypothetical protein
MPKKYPTLITFDEEGDRIEMVRLTSGAKVLDPIILPNRHIDAKARDLLRELGWTRVAARLDLWYRPHSSTMRLIQSAREEKAELDAAARAKGERLAKKRAARETTKPRGKILQNRMHR